jgi:predicted NAD/FAD-dependent oxidoreductase
MARIAIVGAGVSGLAAAYGLRTLPVEVIVFEKSRGYGGRAATRGRYGNRYDHGANYFTPTSERVERLVTAHLPTDGLVEIGRPIWQFDEDGTLCRPASVVEDQPKWTYRQGISRLGKLLARYSRAEVESQTRIERIVDTGSHWRLRAADGSSYAPFDAVVLTPPAPQTAAILANAEVEGARIDRLRQAVASVSYTSQFSYVFAFDRALSRPGGFFGAISDSDQHPLSWIGFEHDKPGHVKSGYSMLVVQTAPGWTAERVDREPDGFVPDVKEWAEDVLVCDLRHPTWYDVQRWRYARPTSALSGEMVASGADLGLFLAGDSVAGMGEVGEALETGLDAAEAVRETL